MKTTTTPESDKNYFSEEELVLWNRFLWVVHKNIEECPWSRIQNLHSMQDVLVEESNELKQAILNHDRDNIIEELGDALYDVFFLIQLAEKEKLGSLSQVLKRISDKIIFRKPWVFGDTKVNSAEEAVEEWYRQKEKEKNNFG